MMDIDGIRTLLDGVEVRHVGPQILLEKIF